MPCYHPLGVYRSKATNQSTGRSWIVWSLPRDIDCYDFIKLPCGQCIGCRLDRSRQWAMRCLHEAQLHDDNCFVTLTYDDDHLPFDLSLKKNIFRIL